MIKITHLFLAFFLIHSIANATNKAGISNPNKPSEFRKGKDYALFFAVNEYDQMNNLQEPIPNAKAIAFELETYYGFQTEVVENPSLKDIEKKLEEYKNNFATNRNGAYDSNGQLLIFFSGHGIEKNLNGFFLPKNADPKRVHSTAISYNYWREEINNIDCKHILVGIDACFSATFDPSWRNRPGVNYGKRPGEYSEGEKLLVNHEENKARLFFTADAKADETPDRSTFAKKFLEGLKNRGGKDGILTSSELFTYLELASPKPHRGEFGDDEPGSSFLFMLSNFKQTPASPTNSDEEKIWAVALQSNTAASFNFYLNLFGETGKYNQQAKQLIQQLPVGATAIKLPDDWFLMDKKRDGFYGLNAQTSVDILLKNRKSKPVTIALIDSGLDYNDKTINDLMWVNAGEIAGNGIDDDRNGYIDDIHGYAFGESSNSNYNYIKSTAKDNQHGTQMAKLMLKISPPNTHFKLMDIRVRGDEEEVYYPKLDVAILCAVINGANIIYMGFGTYQSLSKEVTKAIQYAEKNDVLVIHAAGDGTVDTDLVNWYPNDKTTSIRKTTDNWLEVGASDAKGSAADFSNYGSKNVDVFAPGVDIKIEEQMLSGTDVSAAIVTGTAGVLLSYFPKLSAEQLKDIIMKSVEQEHAKNNIGTKSSKSKISIMECQSGGIVNLKKAIELAIGQKGKRK